MPVDHLLAQRRTRLGFGNDVADIVPALQHVAGHAAERSGRVRITAGFGFGRLAQHAVIDRIHRITSLRGELRADLVRGRIGAAKSVQRGELGG